MRTRSVAVLGMAVFAALALMVKLWGAAPFDAPVRDAVHALASPPLTALMRWLTDFGRPLVLIALSLLAAAGCVLTRHKDEALFFVAVMAGTLAMEVALKAAFARERPAEAFFATAMPHSFSFPSGHAMHAAAFFGALAVVGTGHIRRRNRRAALWCGACLLALAIGFSRVYLGVHYPSDVLAGFAAGGAWTAAAARFRRARI